ncbi:DNA primase [Candidatus Saccharibacteria bacterium]|nr:DNA primase [Candidatus Saccharibacteria bacterium]
MEFTPIERYNDGMQDAKEEVRSRLNIEDVIGEYVVLKRAGRNFKGLSPFSGEKTPSFIVSPDKQIWHDFSSNKGGDVFSFVMEVEGLDFRQALELLARKAGVDLSMYESKNSTDMARRKKRLIEANNLAADYYQRSLIENQHARDYVISKRGLGKTTIQDFRIGYAPSSGDALVNFLKKKGYSTKDLDQAGLVNRFSGDLFRGRMMVPLMDSTGSVIGFTGRILTDDKNSPKYLNTPQTLLYDKSRHVFGLSQAKEAIRQADRAVIVEGNLDVVSSHQAGIKNVVATAGTALTEYHLKALMRLTGHISLAFDNDKPGLAATERAIEIAQNIGVELYIVSLPVGSKDPDELIKKDVSLWSDAIIAAEPAVDWILKQYQNREDLSTAVGKKHFTTAALKVVRMISDSVEKEHYLNKIAEISDSSVEALGAKMSEPVETHNLKPIAARVDTAQDPDSYQDNLLAVALTHGPAHELFRQIDKTIFGGEERQAVVDFLSSSKGKTVQEVPKQLQKYDIYVKILLLRAEERYGNWDDQARYFEVAELLRQVASDHKRKEKDKLTQKLRDAETAGDDVEAARIRAILNQLIKEIQSGQRPGR